MSFGARVTGEMQVRHRLKALPLKLQKRIQKKVNKKVAREAIKDIRKELGSGEVFNTLKILAHPNRKARAKAKTEKGQIGVAARVSRQELKKSIGLRTKPLKMKDKHAIFNVVGPRSGFKVTNIRSASKRIPLAAATVCKMIELGTSFSPVTAFMRRVIQMQKSKYKDSMIAAAKELISEAGK